MSIQEAIIENIAFVDIFKALSGETCQAGKYFCFLRLAPHGPLRYAGEPYNKFGPDKSRAKPDAKDIESGLTDKYDMEGYDAA